MEQYFLPGCRLLTDNTGWWEIIYIAVASTLDLGQARSRQGRMFWYEMGCGAGGERKKVPENMGVFPAQYTTQSLKPDGTELVYSAEKKQVSTVFRQ